MCPILFIRTSIDRLVAMVNSAALNICVQISVQVPAVSVFGYLLISGIAGSYGNSMFNFLRIAMLISTVDGTIL